MSEKKNDNKEIITQEQLALLKQTSELSLSSMLKTLDEFDELLGSSLNIEKMVIDRISDKGGDDYDDKDIELLKASHNHTIQIFIRRHSIKMQIAAKFTNNGKQQTEQQT